MYTTKIDIDLSGERAPVTIYAKQGDVAARQLDIGFIDNGTVYKIPAGTIPRIWISKPDGTAIFNDAVISDNRVIAELTGQALAAAGKAIAEISLYEGEDRILSSAVFTIVIERNARDNNAIESSNEFGKLDSLIKEAEISIPAATKAAAVANQAAKAAAEATTEAETAAKTANETSTDIIAAKNRGDFDGSNGVITTMSGQYGFQINDGHLYLHYAAEDEPPDFMIEEETGHLILTI